MSRSKNNSKNTEKNAVRPYTVMCTDMYLLWILIVFPLYYADGYFHLPEKKAMFWTVSTLVYVIVCLVGVVITAFSMRENWSMENFKKNITMTDVFMFGFLISNLIALAISDDPMGSWVGQNARYYGARVLILVCVVYFLVSRYAWINQVFIVAFLIGGNGVCLLATFDYFGMDVLGINKQMQPEDWFMFISTMGNANTCASYVCMTLVAAMAYFCVAKNVKAKIMIGITIANCTAALVSARSESAFVGIGVVIILLFVCVFNRKVNVKDFILMLQAMDIGLIVLFIIRNLNEQKIIFAPYDGWIAQRLNNYILLFGSLSLLCVTYLLLCILNRKQINIKKRIKTIICITIIVGMIGTGLMILQKINIFNVFMEGMGNKSIAGSRTYIYTKTLQAYSQMPIKNKIFGNGQASMINVMNRYFGDELAQAGISINSAHNHVLDYLTIIGLFGVVCYIGVFINIIKHTFQSLIENKLALVFGSIVIAYFAQGLFNIEQTNTTTVFWLMIACCEALYRQNIKKKDTN